MSITIRKLEELAPDQASLDAAAKLKKGRSKWSGLATDGALVWGECQGSGANPYRAIGDPDDLGYKCTCPSRKFPCKHVLALLWLHVEAPQSFAQSSTPEWVKDWLSRRRKPNATTPSSRGRASVLTPERARETPKRTDAETEAKAAQAADRARLARHRAVIAGLEEVERWLLDVIGQGLAAFQTSMHDQCRTLARRLIDAKAPALAGRVDQLPSEILQRPTDARPQATLEALGRIHLLCEAYRRLAHLPAPLQADVRRLIGFPLKKEAVLRDAGAPRAKGPWSCFGARTIVQADDLQRVESWFERASPSEDGPLFALLVDYHPSIAGRMVSPFSPGDRLEGELVFYPSAAPLRALIAEPVDAPALEERPAPEESSAPAERPAPRGTLGEVPSAVRELLITQPWLGSWPFSAGPATIALSPEGRTVLTDGQSSLPIHPSQQAEAKPLVGIPIHAARGTWTGWAATLFSADTAIGLWIPRETGP